MAAAEHPGIGEGTARSMARTIVEVGVVGLGQMGAGIAEVFARNGIAVVGVEPTEDALERGRGHLQRSTDRAVQRGRLSADDQQAILDRITFTTAMADAEGLRLGDRGGARS